MHMMIEKISLPLFVPADRPERFAKAVNARPDAVIIDLEDAVAPDNKATARDGLARVLVELSSALPLIVRINAIGTSWHDDDLRIVKQLPLAVVMLPKSESDDDIKRVAVQSEHPVIALIESAKGLENARKIAKPAARLAFGSIDYAADLAMGHTQLSLLNARSEIVLASRLANIPAPLDGVTTAINAEDILLNDCAHAVELGFGGKLLIHPAQIAPAREGFKPSQQELDWACRVLDAAQSGNAALRVDGAMVDAPVILRARQICIRAGAEFKTEG